MSVTQLIKVSPLPTRRYTWRESFEWEGIKWFLDCGFAADGSVREIFLTPRNAKVSLAATMADACIGISFLLQRGMTAAEYTAKLLPLPHAGEYAAGATSLIADALRRAVRIEIDKRDDALAIYAMAAAR